MTTDGQDLERVAKKNRKIDSVLSVEGDGGELEGMGVTMMVVG